MEKLVEALADKPDTAVVNALLAEHVQCCAREELSSTRVERYRVEATEGRRGRESSSESTQRPKPVISAPRGRSTQALRRSGAVAMNGIEHESNQGGISLYKAMAQVE